jgi:hypothetical protein
MRAGPIIVGPRSWADWVGSQGHSQPSLRIEGCETASLPWRGPLAAKIRAGCRATSKLWPLPRSADRRPLAQLKGGAGAFGVVVGHSPSTILSLPALVSRSPPDNSCMYPSWISRSLCSTGIARCIKPLAQSRNETNSSWVNGGGAGAIPRICASFSSGRLTSSNVATWVLSNQDSNTAPQTSQDARPVCGIKNFASVRSYSAPQLHLTIVAILGICARNRPFSSA